MVLILDGSSEHVAHERREIGLFGEKKNVRDWSRSNKMHLTDQIAEIAPYVRTYFSVTI